MGGFINLKGIIDGIDFFNLDAMKYYSVPNTWSEEKKKDNAINKIFSGDWWGAQKRDGIFMMLLCDEDDNVLFRPRSKNVKGEFVDKTEWVPQLAPFFRGIPNGTCLLGELYLPRDEQAKATSSIMNCLKDKAISRQQKEEDKLHFYVFDILAHEGKSLLDTPALERFNLLKDYEEIYSSAKYVEWATYKNGEELWNMLQNLLADGYEGVVITNAAAHYQPGKRSNAVSLKIKKELQDTIDCVVIGANPPTKLYTGKEIRTWTFWLNELTNEKVSSELYEDYANGEPIIPVTKNWFYGWAGSLRLGAYKDGKLVEIGSLSGVTDEVKENWKDYIGKVAEVTAMEIMDTGGLRHPKLCNFRDDINAEECTYERIFS